LKCFFTYITSFLRGDDDDDDDDGDDVCDSILGHGAFGDVYEGSLLTGEDACRTTAPVAIKVLSALLSDFKDLNATYTV